MSNRDNVKYSHIIDIDPSNKCLNATSQSPGNTRVTAGRPTPDDPQSITSQQSVEINIEKDEEKKKKKNKKKQKKNSKSITEEHQQNQCTDLHLACQRLDAERVMLLLEEGADVNALDGNFLTPLDVVGEDIPPEHTSPIESFLSVMESLLDRKGEPTTKVGAKYRETPVHVAVNLESSEAIEKLFKAGYNRLLINQHGHTPLHAVIGRRQEELLKVLLSLYKPTGLDTQNREGETALHIAVKVKWFEGVRTLLQSGADITVKMTNDTTILHHIHKNKDWDIINELLNHYDIHKIINERDKCNNLPLFLAIHEKDFELVFSLVDAMADLTLTHGTYNVNVLLAAVQARQPKILKGLFKRDKKCMDNFKEATVSTKRLTDATPLHMAAFYNLHECIDVLVANKCDLRAKATFNKKPFTPLQLAALRGHDRVVKILLNCDPTLVNEPDSMGMMPIHWACINNHGTVIKDVTDAGCDLSAKCGLEGGESRTTAMDVFINRVPGAVIFLEQILDSAITVNMEGVKFNYRRGLLLPKVKENCRQLKVLNALVQTDDQVDQGRLFTHPVVQTFLRLHWERMRRFYFILILIFLLLLVIPFYVLVITVFYCDEKLSNFPYWSSIMFILMVIGFVIYISHEICYFIFKTQYSKYYCQWTFSKGMVLFNLKSLAWVVKMLLICVLLFYPFTNVEAAFSRELAMCAVLLICLEFMMLVSRIPTYGIYMLMFFEVTSNLIVIMFSFTFLVLGFMTTFLVEFHGEKPFDSVSEAFLKTFVMMTSELDYSQLFDANKDSVAIAFTKVIFLMFLLIVVIVIMNIVLAKAILDVKKVDRLRKHAEFLNTYEQLLSFYNPFLLLVNNMISPRCSALITNTSIEPTLFIRFDEPNRFHNNLMQSIMERAYNVILDKTKHDSRKQDNVTKISNGSFNKISTQLDELMNKLNKQQVGQVEMNKLMKTKEHEITKISNAQLDKLLEMNKLMMETITSFSTKLDAISQKVDLNTDNINLLSASLDLVAQPI